MMYFGNRKLMRWVKAPAPGASFSAIGYSDRLDYISGGVGVRESANAHLEYTVSWESADRADIRLITDYAYGTYGDDPIVWLDPLSMDSNILNKGWSMPGLATKDAVPLVGLTRPDSAPNADMSMGYPVDMARYTIQPGEVPRKFHVPVPAGYTAWIGAHGEVAAAGMVAQPTLGGVDFGAGITVPVLSTSTDIRFSTSIVGGEGVGFDLSLIPTPLPGTATVAPALAGVMVQVLKTGKTPERGGFISGEGHSGCKFEGKPTRTPYFFADGRESIGMAAKLTEIGDWP